MNDDLISRNALLKKAVVPFPCAFSSMISSWEVATAPAVDAVEVVRCKDCKAWQTKNAMSFLRDGVHVRYCPCVVLGRLMYDNDFCSRGERRTDE